jgi:hypothetical protein
LEDKTADAMRCGGRQEPCFLVLGRFTSFGCSTGAKSSRSARILRARSTWALRFAAQSWGVSFGGGDFVRMRSQ